MSGLKSAFVKLFLLVAFALTGCNNPTNTTKYLKDDFIFASTSDLIAISKEGPREASQGIAYTYQIKIHALHDSGETIVRDKLAEGLQYVSAVPPAETKKDGQLEWWFGSLKAGEDRVISVTVKPTTDGNFTTCAVVFALPIACQTTKIGSPKLAITKSAPATRIVGESIPYNVVVTNVGTSVVRDVVMNDPLPNGITAKNGQTELSFKLGHMKPGESREINFLGYGAKKGTYKNVATATASNTASVSAAATTVLLQPSLTITKTGPDSQLIGKTATYNITVGNPGDTALKNVMVRDDVPGNWRVLEAPGGDIRGNDVNWNIPDLQPNGSKSFTVTVTNRIPGQWTNVAWASSGSLRKEASQPTLWKGFAALLVEVIDTQDPLLSNEETVYEIRVTNQGSAADNNILVKASFSGEVVPTDISVGQGKIDGNSIVFDTIPVLDAKNQVVFQVKAKAAKVGDARLRVTLQSDLLKTPVVEEESTHVY